jgi:hypothetical protein
MELEGDLHNFGQKVQKLVLEGKCYFEKPRPICWEWLFFGRESPLISIFKTEATLANQFFNLEIEFTENYHGRALSVTPVAGGSHQELLFSAGALLAYCFIWGIRDLHQGNILQVGDHLQVVDAEVVFADLVLPHETHLLPFKELGPRSCGLKHVVDLTKPTSETDFKFLFNGYTAAMSVFLNKQKEIIDTITQLLPVVREIPVRHIARSTQDYREWKTLKTDNPFFQSELTQLQRGDIPYFFKFLGSPSVFALETKEWKAVPVELPTLFRDQAAREATNPRDLISVQTVSKKAASGLMYLVAKFFPEEGLQLTNNGISLATDNREVQVSILSQSFKTTFKPA